MTNEEAIEILQEEHDWVQEPSYVINAIEKAIAALRSLDAVEPLTLEQLRGMDGKPVWVQTPGIEKYGRWAIVAGVNIEDNALYCQGDYTCRDYGKMWIAYAYPPAHIDREAWVSVEERMPEEGRLVIVWCRSRMSTRHVTASTFYDGKWSRRVRDVTHWMPLPEPPDVPTEEK